jgi:translation initiation factor 2 gamma subunit (eIF-2gamma)
MKKLALTAAVIGLAFAVASPAQAAAKKHRRHAVAGAYAMTPGGTTAEFQGGVLKGPIYNGQDYIGDDPDPNIRAYLIRDLDSRYGGGR